MNSTQLGMIRIVDSAVNGKQNILPADFDLNAAIKIARRHQIVPMLYYGALQCGISPKTPQMQQLFVQTCQYLAVNEKQMLELQRICAAFDEAQVEYMPLKGTLLKGMYPKPEMRPMSDADILIRVEQYGQIKPIMERLGFEEQIESDHELIWHKPQVHIELHKRLIPSYNKDYYAYFGDGWRLAKPLQEQPNRFAMTPEDQLIYLFTHYAKHYRDAGIGIKHFVDLWIYRSKVALDEEYIHAELKKLKLDAFYDNTLRALAVWFDEGQPDAVTELITETVFQSGVYGTHEGHLLSDAVKTAKAQKTAKRARRKKILDTVFLPYKAMCERFPVVKKVPVLLPFMWVVRWATALFTRGRVGRRREELKTISVERIDGYQQALQTVGLDFNFKE